MTISPPDREAKKVKVLVERNPVQTSFEKWAKPGHFCKLNVASSTMAFL